MKTEIMMDKVYNYLRSRLFPWNFLMEPVDDATIEHFIKEDFMIPPGMDNEPSKEELLKIICDEVQKIANEYLNARHSRLVDPFAYAQALIYTMLYDLQRRQELRGLGDIVDAKALAKLMGISMDSFERKEKLIWQLIQRYKDSKPSAKNMLGQKVTYGDGTLIGTVHNIVYDDRTGDLLELKVKTDKELLAIPIDGIRLKNVYNNYVILKE
ncbi:MAG: PRC-barrel domain-containing protein [Methanocellales archaeon]|nr:PRC-barrel domain-containing protein [Methanocellales archaeon]